VFLYDLFQLQALQVSPLVWVVPFTPTLSHHAA
jgi:hypothetical protein